MTTASKKLLARLEDLADDLLYETQDFPGQQDYSKAKIRELAVELEALIRKLVERS